MAEPGLTIGLPGRGALQLRYLILDLNGTITLDGALIDGVAERIAALQSCLAVSLLTADTRGTAAGIAAELGCRLRRLEPGNEAEQKSALVRQLGAASVTAIGNGANDTAMLTEAALGIAVVGPEGLAVAALLAADLIVGDINAALDLLVNPQRLIATLRR